MRPPAAELRARSFAALALLATLLLGPSPAVSALAGRGVDATLFAGMRWRNIGPFRGGRALAVAGVSGDPLTYYFGAAGGGVWKTTNAGLTWKPVSDGVPVASIGALAVAPSDPAVVYAGSGEADMRSDVQHGNGVYRSRDGGATWTHAGLDDSRQIGRILVDPHDPQVVLVAALGHQYGPNDMRGVYRSADGGATWTTPERRGGSSTRTRGCGNAAGTSVTSPSIRRTRTLSTCRTPRSTARPTAARRSARSKARPTAMIFTASGSIRPSRHTSRSSAIRAPR